MVVFYWNAIHGYDYETKNVEKDVQYSIVYKV